MRTLFGAVGWVVAATVAGEASAQGGAAGDVRPPPSDSAAVRAVVERINAGFARRDAALAAGAYADGAEFVNAFGNRRTGRAAIEALYADVLARPQVAAVRTTTPFRITALRFPSPDVAAVWTSVVAEGQTTSRGAPLGPRRQHWLVVVRRGAAGWQVTDHLVMDERG